MVRNVWIHFSNFNLSCLFIFCVISNCVLFYLFQYPLFRFEGSSSAIAMSSYIKDQGQDLVSSVGTRSLYLLGPSVCFSPPKLVNTFHFHLRKRIRIDVPTLKTFVSPLTSAASALLLAISWLL